MTTYLTRIGALLCVGLFLTACETPGADRRDDRQVDRVDDRDGRQDCREGEDRLGGDTRDCRQDERQDG